MMASVAPFSSVGFMVIDIGRRFLEASPAAFRSAIRRPRRPRRTFCAFAIEYLQTVLVASGQLPAGARVRERRAGPGVRERGEGPRSWRGATRRIQKR